MASSSTMPNLWGSDREACRFARCLSSSVNIDSIMIESWCCVKRTPIAIGVTLEKSAESDESSAVSGETSESGETG